MFESIEVGVTLVGLLSCMECPPVYQKVADLIPSQDTYLDCRVAGLIPVRVNMGGNQLTFLSQSHQFYIDVSLSLSPPPPPSHPPLPFLSL